MKLLLSFVLFLSAIGCSTQDETQDLRTDRTDDQIDASFKPEEGFGLTNSIKACKDGSKPTRVNMTNKTVTCNTADGTTEEINPCAREGYTHWHSGNKKHRIYKGTLKCYRYQFKYLSNERKSMRFDQTGVFAKDFEIIIDCNNAQSENPESVELLSMGFVEDGEFKRKFKKVDCNYDEPVVVELDEKWTTHITAEIFGKKVLLEVVPKTKS